MSILQRLGASTYSGGSEISFAKEVAGVELSLFPPRIRVVVPTVVVKLLLMGGVGICAYPYLPTAMNIVHEMVNSLIDKEKVVQQTQAKTALGVKQEEANTARAEIAANERIAARRLKNEQNAAIQQNKLDSQRAENLHEEIMAQYEPAPIQEPVNASQSISADPPQPLESGSYSQSTTTGACGENCQVPPVVTSQQIVALPQSTATP